MVLFRDESYDGAQSLMSSLSFLLYCLLIEIYAPWLISHSQPDILPPAARDYRREILTFENILAEARVELNIYGRIDVEILYEGVFIAAGSKETPHVVKKTPIFCYSLFQKISVTRTSMGTWTM